MTAMYLWLKALHIIAVIAWMAGMLYLPATPGPHPAIVLHQGSERDSWKDANTAGYLFAAHGVAGEFSFEVGKATVTVIEKPFWLPEMLLRSKIVEGLDLFRNEVGSGQSF